MQIDEFTRSDFKKSISQVDCKNLYYDDKYILFSICFLCNRDFDDCLKKFKQIKVIKIKQLMTKAYHTVIKLFKNLPLLM